MFDSLLLQVLCSGIISGMILFQVSVIAPTVFKILETDEIRKFLRNVFPKLFKVVSLTGLLSFLSALAFNTVSILQYVMSLVTFLLAIFCLLIVPATNNAKDEGNDKLFSLLHRISVFSTMTILVMNLFWVFLL